MRIGISGSSGQLGSAVIAGLLERSSGHQVVGISRSPEKIYVPAEGRYGNYDEPETLAAAYRGLDRLLIIPSAELSPGVRGRQYKAAIDAAVRAAVGHIVLMSAAGTREAAAGSLGEAYWMAENHLIKTAPHWTILRMNYYSESLADEARMSFAAGFLSGLGEDRVAFVSRNDVAAAAVGILLTEGRAGAVYNATGPAAVTGAERAAMITKITGKPLAFSALSEQQLRGGLTQAGLPEVVVNAIAEIKANFVAGDFNIVTGDVQRLAGHAPKSLYDVLAAALA